MSGRQTLRLFVHLAQQIDDVESIGRNIIKTCSSDLNDPTAQHRLKALAQELEVALDRLDWQLEE